MTAKRGHAARTFEVNFDNERAASSLRAKRIFASIVAVRLAWVLRGLALRMLVGRYRSGRVPLDALAGAATSTAAIPDRYWRDKA